MDNFVLLAGMEIGSKYGWFLYSWFHLLVISNDLTRLAMDHITYNYPDTMDSLCISKKMIIGERYYWVLTSFGKVFIDQPELSWTLK